MKGRFLGGLFHGPSGDVSSKRVSAMALVISGIVLAFLHPEQAVTVGTLVGSGLTMFGVQAITKT